MATATKTLKLPFLRLNRSKAEELSRLQCLNAPLANRVLALPKKERRGLTTKSFRDVEIGSAWINQTIRSANARTKVKKFKCLPLGTNNQNWTLHKVGDTYSVAFGLVRGIKKPVPLEVHPAAHQRWLDAILEGKAKPGSIKLSRSRRGLWYALISVALEVPEAENKGLGIGVDRGQNAPAVGAVAEGGRLVFFKANWIRHLRRVYSRWRQKLQKLGEHRALKKLERRERRTITHINHKISKEIVGLAERTGHGIAVANMPAAYTSKTHHLCGRIGVRKGKDFYCMHCDKHEHADGNAARNIGGLWGMLCALEPSKPSSVMGDKVPLLGPDDTAPELGTRTQLGRVERARTRIPGL